MTSTEVDALDDLCDITQDLPDHDAIRIRDALQLLLSNPAHIAHINFRLNYLPN